MLHDGRTVEIVPAVQLLLFDGLGNLNGSGDTSTAGRRVFLQQLAGVFAIPCHIELKEGKLFFLQQKGGEA